jgi:hypothetical protein
VKEFLIVAVLVGLLLAWLVHKDACTWGHANSPLWQLTHCSTLYSAEPAPEPVSPPFRYEGLTKEQLDQRAAAAVAADRERYGIAPYKSGSCGGGPGLPDCGDH